jgi:hypothetical protein
MGSDMAATTPPPREVPGRVLPFRPRPLPPAGGPPASPVADLRKYETVTEAEDDYRHRMIVNGLASVVTVLLVVGGIWIANTLAHLRSEQDCMLSGRRACAPLDLATHLP